MPNRVILAAILIVTASLPVYSYTPPVPDKETPYERECVGIIGEGNCAGTSWGVQCSDTECLAWTNCPNGTTVTCDGNYRAAADEGGVVCSDTGGGDYEWESCTP